MSQSPHHLNQGQELVSRRAALKSGIAATAVVFATLKTARRGDAAVTSMDRAPVLQPLTPVGKTK